ncbi:MAG: type II toxin-antitoxin system VapC family toxin [Verrucomicrobiota bacterium]
MDTFVLDASTVLAFLLQEGSPNAEAVFLKHLSRGAIAHVPTLWHLEIRNVLFLKERSGKLAAGAAGKAIAQLDNLSIVTDPYTTAPSTLMHIERLMLNHGLTSYDAAYLELACRLGVPIATQDQDLIHAAKALKVARL